MAKRNTVDQLDPWFTAPGARRELKRAGRRARRRQLREALHSDPDDPVIPPRNTSGWQ